MKLACVFSESRVANEKNHVDEKHDCNDSDHDVAEDEQLGAHSADESEEDDSAGDGVQEAEVLGHAPGDDREADLEAANQYGEGEYVTADENSAPGIAAIAAATRCSRDRCRDIGCLDAHRGTCSKQDRHTHINEAQNPMNL